MAILPQGKMQYEVAGVYPAPSFFGIEVASERAQVKVIRSLKQDSLQLSSYTVSTHRLNIWICM